ncbi:hypothetical protein DFH09DRAFT_1090778 [Mycena vulgaris]|nr:hypothetical protein DFH09DRAFT_1090778 [Mycena vulgaris]
MARNARRSVRNPQNPRIKLRNAPTSRLIRPKNWAERDSAKGHEESRLQQESSGNMRWVAERWDCRRRWEGKLNHRPVAPQYPGDSEEESKGTLEKELRRRESAESEITLAHGWNTEGR